MTYESTKDWFLKSEMNSKLLSMVTATDKYTILEIGCYEGLSSVFFADNLLNHQDSSLTCVDPYLSDRCKKDRTLPNGDEIEARFHRNIKLCKNSKKITVHKLKSDDFFKLNNKIFNFIYVDGNHRPGYVKRDVENSFKCLENGGIMWMDDYLIGDGIEVRNTIDNFVNEHKNQLEVIHSGYQLAIKKI
jgi:predicted O-methyltransferase YrrM